MEPRSTEICEEGCYAALTHEHLRAQEMIDRVRSPQAGAIVLFAGELMKSRPTFLSIVFSVLNIIHSRHHER